MAGLTKTQRAGKAAYAAANPQEDATPWTDLSEVEQEQWITAAENADPGSGSDEDEDTEETPTPGEAAAQTVDNAVAKNEKAAQQKDEALPVAVVDPVQERPPTLREMAKKKYYAAEGTDAQEFETLDREAIEAWEKLAKSK